MHDGSFWVEMENFGCHTVDVPRSHGSRTMVKAYGDRLVQKGDWRMGSKVRRKEASELRCLTVKDIFKSLDDAVENGGDRHAWNRRNH